MLTIFKLCAVFAAFAVVNSETTEEVLKCNLRHCGSELLNFEKFGIAQIFRKLELASFCVKNCTPPIVQEFFQSILFAINKRIPGHCTGADCVDKNRFVALAKCLEDESWPLLQCGKKLIDLAHIGLVQDHAEGKRNTTCRIVTDAVQCFEESLQVCGETPFKLVKEILGDLIKIGINAYCHPSYRKEGLFIKRTTEPTLPSGVTRVSTEEYTGATYKLPQYVKGYNPNNAHGFPVTSYVCILSSLLASVLFSLHPSY